MRGSGRKGRQPPAPEGVEVDVGVGQRPDAQQIGSRTPDEQPIEVADADDGIAGDDMLPEWEDVAVTVVDTAQEGRSLPPVVLQQDALLEKERPGIDARDAGEGGAR